jgi:predicted dehydrogenase
MSGGVVVDMHIHDLDFFNWIFGHPKRIYSKGSKSTAHCWDHMSSLVYYPKGKACGEASWWWREANFPFSSRLSLLCERGGIEIGVTTSFAEPDVPMKERVWLHAAEKGAKLLRLPRKDGYAREIEYFVNCVKEDEEPKLCKPEDARLALELALAARQSAETETSVMLSSHKA